MRLACLIALLTAAVVPVGIRAATATPLPTDRQWLQIGAGLCHPGIVNGTPDCPGAGTASGFLDHTVELAHADWTAFGVTIKGGGSTAADTLRLILSANGGFTFASAVIVDTYTITGPAGPVPVTVTLDADAIFNAVLTTAGFVAGRGRFGVLIGDGMRADGRGVTNILAADNADTLTRQDTTQVPISLTATYNMTAAVGTPFTLAYAFTITGTSGVLANALNTALIDIGLPQGYAISSVLGYGASSAIPEAPALALVGLGLLGLGLATRRRETR